VTVRAIAARLGSSTMPIYSHLRSVEEVEEAVRTRARELLVAFQRREWTSDPLLNMAFGYIAFARDEIELFRFLFIERADAIGASGMDAMRSSFIEQFGEDVTTDSALADLDAAGQEALMRHTWIFTHGLAVLVNAGSLPDCTDETVLTFLRNAGEAFFMHAMVRQEGSTPGPDTGGDHGTE
jgi:AcrR family transcriptional regulator